MKTYITFGQIHIHYINDIPIYKDCIAAIEHDENEDGHDIAMELFNANFHNAYPEEYFNTIKDKTMPYYPRGIIEIGYHTLNAKRE